MRGEERRETSLVFCGAALDCGNTLCECYCILSPAQPFVADYWKHTDLCLVPILSEERVWTCGVASHRPLPCSYPLWGESVDMWRCLTQTCALFLSSLRRECGHVALLHTDLCLVPILSEERVWTCGVASHRPVPCSYPLWGESVDMWHCFTQLLPLNAT
jgi:hypothetical protein